MAGPAKSYVRLKIRRYQNTNSFLRQLPSALHFCVLLSFLVPGGGEGLGTACMTPWSILTWWQEEWIFGPSEFLHPRIWLLVFPEGEALLSEICWKFAVFSVTNDNLESWNYYL